MRKIRVLRVDPIRRTIATMFLKPVKDPSPQIHRLICTKDAGQRQIMEYEGNPLMVIAGRDTDESIPGWWIRGIEDTAGVSLLTGRNKPTGALIDVPVTREWLLGRIEWLNGEDVDKRAARAREMLSSLAPDVTLALQTAVVTPPNGDIWISAAAREQVGTALVTLGLATERSNGQLLTPLGEAVHDLLVFGFDVANENEPA